MTDKEKFEGFKQKVILPANQLKRRQICIAGGFFGDSYSKEAHAGVAQMYVDDPRFTAYYDERQPGLAAFLRDAVLIYTGMKKQARMMIT